MAAQQYEVEIKGLLGTEDAADDFKYRLVNHSVKPVLTSVSKQLNHYFKGGNPSSLLKSLNKYLSSDSKKKLAKIIESGRNVSVRTRLSNKDVLFVVKASLGADTSSNGVIRIELEQKVKLSLDELDKKIVEAGYSYEAKWSRKREEFKIKDVTICLDKNAGYGYLVEFEKVLKNSAQLSNARKDLLKFMSQFRVPELKQSKLEKMFAYYNGNWKRYYGTDKVFDYSKI